MKYHLLTFALLAVLLVGSAVPALGQYRENDEKYAAQNAQPFDDPARASPNKDLKYTMGELEIVLEWGAPYVRGRLLTGGLISTYKVWRTGANEATTIYFSKDVLIEGEKLPAGTYALFTIGGKKKWTVIFNKEYQQWGAFSYTRAEDVLRVKVDPGTNEHEEQLTFDFVDTTDDSANLRLRWGDLDVRFQIQPDPQAL